jgi:hypothetical protein
MFALLDPDPDTESTDLIASGSETLAKTHYQFNILLYDGLAGAQRWREAVRVSGVRVPLPPAPQHEAPHPHTRGPGRH